ncbi:MAG: FeoA domain-containing protein [Spirochaetales bacterium]|nr:FeoA domain-containing protein [Spirochaetales bacterium]
MKQQIVKDEAYTLSMSKPGTVVKVLSIMGGRMLRQRLLNLGIVPGVNLKCIRGGGGYPMVLEVQNSRVVLGAGMSVHVFVRVINE